MSKQTHDTFPVRLRGKRKASLILPVDLTPEDAALIQKHVAFIAECSADHNQELPEAAADSPTPADSQKGN